MYILLFNSYVKVPCRNFNLRTKSHTIPSENEGKKWHQHKEHFRCQLFENSSLGFVILRVMTFVRVGLVKKTQKTTLER